MTNQLTITRPGFDPIAILETAPDLADSTRTKYTRALARYLDSGGDLFDAEQLAVYASSLSNSGRSFLKSAVAKVTARLGTGFKGAATPENVAAIQAAIYRIEALNSAIETEQTKGTKTHIWLSQAQVRQMLDCCDTSTTKGRRDRLALGLLVAAGLRRAEAAALRFDDVVLQPVGDRFRTVLAICGKGAKNRQVPISASLASAIESWSAMVGGDGLILRSVDQSGEISESLSTVGLFHLVRSYGAQIGKPKLAPHDLRRTYARLGLDAGVPVTQISVLLGHSSIATTQRYLGLKTDLEQTVSDFVPF